MGRASLTTTYCFDIDGAPLNSEADIRGAVLDVCSRLGRDEIPAARVRRYIGRALKRAVAPACAPARSAGATASPPN